MTPARRPDLVIVNREEKPRRDGEEPWSAAVYAAESRPIHLIDGTLVSWYGPRIGRAIEALRPRSWLTRDHLDRAGRGPRGESPPDGCAPP
jgi:hypothetical protein